MSDGRIRAFRIINGQVVEVEPICEADKPIIESKNDTKLDVNQLGLAQTQATGKMKSSSDVRLHEQSQQEDYNETKPHDHEKMHIVRSQDSFQVWSHVRVPNDSLSDAQLKLKNIIQTELKSLRVFEQGLYASYGSMDPSFFDVENILFYNLRETKTFSALMEKGLTFERRFDLPTLNSVGETHFKHHYFYGAGAGFRYWEIEELLSDWSFVEMPLKHKKPDKYWHAIKEQSAGINVHRQMEKIDYFAICMEIRVPPRTNLGFASWLKPFLDGLTSAFHYNDDAEFDFEALDRLGNMLSLDLHEVCSFISDPSKAVLGSRRLIHSFRKSIKWDPLDDYCVACQIELKEDKTIQTNQISGYLCSVTRVGEDDYGY